MTWMMYIHLPAIFVGLRWTGNHDTGHRGSHGDVMADLKQTIQYLPKLVWIKQGGLKSKQYTKNTDKSNLYYIIPESYRKGLRVTSKQNVTPKSVFQIIFLFLIVLVTHWTVSGSLTLPGHPGGLTGPARKGIPSRKKQSIKPKQQIPLVNSLCSKNLFSQICREFLLRNMWISLGNTHLDAICWSSHYKGCDKQPPHLTQWSGKLQLLWKKELCTCGFKNSTKVKEIQGLDNFGTIRNSGLVWIFLKRWWFMCKMGVFVWSLIDDQQFMSPTKNKDSYDRRFSEKRRNTRAIP